MDTQKILNADILDIIFDGRNKAYGAYELRKNYNERLIKAVLIVVAATILIFVGSMVSKSVTKEKTEMIVQDVQLENIQQKEEPKPEPPPPPPPPKQEPPKVEIAKFTPPKIVKDEEVKPEEKIKETEKLEDVKIGVVNQEGIKTDVVAPPVEKGTGVVEAPKVEKEDYDNEFKTVQREAKFPGGTQAWVRFLERNLDSNVPNDNNAPPGSYTVIVSFLVDKGGNISEVKAENDPGYGTAQEAVRVIRRGPKWEPAEQNGRNVIYRQRQSITFRVE